MATEEVPFETAGQVEEKLALFEKLFGPRYSEQDKWYDATNRKSERLELAFTYFVAEYG